jgi:hypothetical protein
MLPSGIIGSRHGIKFLAAKEGGEVLQSHMAGSHYNIRLQQLPIYRRLIVQVSNRFSWHAQIAL